MVTMRLCLGAPVSVLVLRPGVLLTTLFWWQVKLCDPLWYTSFQSDLDAQLVRLSALQSMVTILTVLYFKDRLNKLTNKYLCRTKAPKNSRPSSVSRSSIPLNWSSISSSCQLVKLHILWWQKAALVLGYDKLGILHFHSEHIILDACCLSYLQYYNY